MIWGFRFIGRPFVKRFALCYRTVVSSVCPVLSVQLVYCGQTVRWIKIKLGIVVGLGTGPIVLDGDPAVPRPQKGGTAAPTFRPMSIVAKRSPNSATAEHLLHKSFMAESVNLPSSESAFLL